MRHISIFILIALIASCRPPIYPPKPAGYFLIDTPAVHEYRLFDRPGYPYTFEYPVYSSVVSDTNFMKNMGENPYWVNIVFPAFGAAINLTYKEFKNNLMYDSMLLKAGELNNFHGVSGLMYQVGGNVASKYQFTATDSMRHFMRGALYFNVTPNADSLQPATDFLVTDIKHMLWTLRWKNP
jgi:gliding motility-associated lipoprotein GldD